MTGRRSRRSMRPSCGVGVDEDALRATLPAVQKASRPQASGPARVGTARVGTAGAGAGDQPATATRSDDDSDLGWGDTPHDDHDEQLRRDVPPHWG